MHLSLGFWVFGKKFRVLGKKFRVFGKNFGVFSNFFWVFWKNLGVLKKKLYNYYIGKISIMEGFKQRSDGFYLSIEDPSSRKEVIRQPPNAKQETTV